MKTLTQGRDDFYTWLAIGHGVHSVKNYTLHVNRFVEFLGERFLTELHVLDVAKFVEHLDSTGKIKDITINNYLASIRAFINYLYLAGEIKLSPKSIKFRKTHAESWQAVKEEQILKMLDEVNKEENKFLRHRNRVILLFLFSTGVRNSELCDLKIDELDLESKIATIKTKKNNRRRVIFWNEYTNDAIKAFLKLRQDDSQYLVISSSKTKNSARKMSPRAIQFVFKKYKENAGIKERLVPHGCRHGFGHRGAMRGANPYVLSDMMGHKSIVSTQVYTRLSSPKIKEVYDKKFAEKDLLAYRRGYHVFEGSLLSMEVEE